MCVPVLYEYKCIGFLVPGKTDGKLEVYDTSSGESLGPWDIAAGGLIVQEAGGIVGDFEGNESWLKTGNIVAANPKVFSQMLQTLSPHLTEDLKTPK